MDEPLHPSTLSEILDRTAQLYRSRFLVFFGIAFIPTATLLVFAGAVALFSVGFGSGGVSAGPLTKGLLAVLAVSGLGLVGLPALVASSALATAALSHAAARAVFGQPITIRDSYRAVWRRGWRYIGLLVVQFTAVWIVPFVAWVLLTLISGGLVALLQSSGFDATVLVGFATILEILGLVAYGVWMTLRLSLAFPACVVEQTGAWAALKRGSALSKGSRGRILVLYLLGAALNWILSIAIWVPFLIVLELIPGADGQKHQQAFGAMVLLVVYGAGFAVQAFTRPVYGIAAMLFYYDQRVRQEAFDIEWMMLKAGLVVPEPAVPPPAEPQAAEPALQSAPVAQPEAEPARPAAAAEGPPVPADPQPDSIAPPVEPQPATQPATQPAPQSASGDQP